MTENEKVPKREELQQLLNKKLENLKELEEIGKDVNYITELSEIALIQLQLESFRESEKNYLICLKHFEKQKDRLGQAAVYGVLGTLYFKKSDYKKSIESYEKAYSIYKELNQVQEQITCLIGIGNNFVKLNNFDEACDTFLHCSAICSDNNDIYNLLDCLGNLVYIHEQQQKWEVIFDNELHSALRYFKKGTNKAIDSNYAELIIRGLSYVAETLFYLGRIKDAKNQYLRALHIAKKIKADNAVIQLEVLLRSLGMQQKNIAQELREYEQAQK